MNQFSSFFPFKFFGSSKERKYLDREIYNDFLEVGNLVRSRRKLLDMTLQDLAIQTKITTPVIEAIESGWLEKLPEYAYLVSMIPILEKELKLTSGTLDVIFEIVQIKTNIRSSSSFNSFTPGNIDILTTWQGSFLYGLFIILGLYFINYQIRDIDNKNRIFLSPVPLKVSSLEKSEIGFHIEKPIDQYSLVNDATRGSSKEWLKLASSSPQQFIGTGILKINFLKPHLVNIRDSGGTKITISLESGSISMRLFQPLYLQVDPPLNPNESVYWNNKIQTPDVNQRGIYRLPKSFNKSTADLPDLPQTAPLSP